MNKVETVTELDMMISDIEADVAKWEDRDFNNGQNVARMYGELSAIVFSLAKVLRQVVVDGSFTVGNG